MKDLASNLREQTNMLLDLFNNRLNKISNTREFLRCIKHSNDVKLFDGEHLAIGIDGSMDYEEGLEMLIFYVNAIAFTSKFRIADKISFDDQSDKSSIGISTAIPLWQADLPNIIDRDDDEFEARYSADKIPYAFMTMAELKLALDAIKYYRDLRLIILDRSLLRTYSPLVRDLKLLIRKKRSPLIGINTKYGKTSLLDITLAYMLGDGNIHVPSRGSYAKYAIIKELLDGEKSKTELKVEDKQLHYLKRLDKQLDHLLLERCDSVISITDYAKNYWRRVSSLTNNITTNIFNGKYPLLLNNRWLSLLDISALNLFILYEIIGRALKNMILLIGIIKDMNTTEFIRAVMPYLLNYRLELSNDRTFFTMLSATNPSIKTPWRSIAYDAAFTTLIYDQGFKAARKAIFREQLFIRAYFQLRTYKHDQMLRSPVFLYDRIFYPEYDSTQDIEAEEWKRSNKLNLFIDNSIIDDLCLNILAVSDSNQIFEAYGHNYLLYLADKAAKFDVKHMRSMLRGISNLYLRKVISNKVLLSKSFREQRYEEERRRSR